MTTPLHPAIERVTKRITERSADTRGAYLASMAAQRKNGTQRGGMGCANMAHTTAALPASDKLKIHAERAPHVGVITAYNDMLSAHQPYEHYPELIRGHARALGATAQVAGGVPAMCDGVTQGASGMELSLFSRDVIALATAVGLSHNVFDAALMLGICDKIVPGLFIGSVQFGHLSTVFVPAGPMTSGLSNDAKAKVRQQYAQGLVGRDALLESESLAYHSPGTCTFYGTANSNQMLMEIMGLHLPGASFVNPGTELRELLSKAALERALANTGKTGEPAICMADIVSEKTIVNGIIGLLATGGSTNHTIHLVAMARAAGVLIDWDDFAELSAVVPLLARVYPNGSADVNHFHAAGGMGFLMQELLTNGLLHGDVTTVMGQGLGAYTNEPCLQDGQLAWRPVPTVSGDTAVLRPVSEPFSADGGLRLLQGNLGRSVVKVSAVKPEHRVVRAQAVVVSDQQDLLALFNAGKINKDLIAVVRYQGPRANGMPELHKLTPPLAVLQDKGFKVALVTDGRMSGASGKVPAAIHLSPEALADGPIARVMDGDWITLDCERGVLELEVDAATLAARSAVHPDLSHNEHGTGRELFGLFRAHASTAESGASPLFGDRP
ncbi:MAG TPA: phosphogluconate dehydratase [Hydrogenophaga sp.]|uniref:phosphogluconate dehydratase n=1 Tax=Hydrogenophaga sp. TaxID=1904254 RepID=UPI0008B0F1D0|nr:phosphogluconate dehydratase [Hydrogenophaga sp.]MBU4183289.1 phosphogluconate dehydratase [Gammaproteobacteria bacterium]OGA78004.1 MAG: phosphogluconate dehydratase [Burkholderiales bacterium GWE1_65_30]OGA94355.1 MAG: phosphogluconate dehydratase [Burkholderiales bacterium GWF1_66_17]OGB36814.1 MAG: phosphogluconate dehydratase [Burkholderiales bacterium RIFCSPLOWO2_02_FULL_66_35]PKO78835.1 MAG: phosphogluconate dehydratase [Betaproteobacteria bacterium HGW-Betaproteobacteria-15]